MSICFVHEIVEVNGLSCVKIKLLRHKIKCVNMLLNYIEKYNCVCRPWKWNCD